MIAIALMLRDWTAQHTKTLQTAANEYIMSKFGRIGTYDHRIMKIRLPVRSAIYKHDTGGLVVRWVTTSESPLSYVFGLYFYSFW